MPFTGYSHAAFLWPSFFDLPQKAGFPCIGAAFVLPLRSWLGTTYRNKVTAILDRSVAAASDVRERAVLRAQRQAQGNLVQLGQYLGPPSPGCDQPAGA